MSYCNSGSKTAKMLNLNSKSTNHDTVTPLTIATDMSPLSTNDEDFNKHCGSFNPIVGKSSDCGYNSSGIMLNRMKSVDSAVCSMFTPSSSLQLSPSSQIGSTYATYDSTSSSNTNNDSAVHAPISQSKSRFISDYNLTTNNLSHIQSTITNFEQIPSCDSVTFMCPGQQYRDYSAEFNSSENSLPLQSGYVMNKSNADNVLLWQNHAFRYESIDKDDRMNISNNNWTFDESGNFGNFTTLSGLNQLFVNSPGKRPITGGHSVTSQPNLSGNQYIRPQNVPWNCYGTSSNIGGTVQPTGSALPSANVKLTSLNSNQQPQQHSQASSNNPWNQALVNQKLGLAPAPVNAMNLSAYPAKMSTNVNQINGKKQHLSQRHIGHSPQNSATAVLVTAATTATVVNNATVVQSKLSINGLQSTNQNINLTAAGDGSLYDSLANNNGNYNYLEKIVSNDNIKINFDKELFDVFRLSLDDTDNYTSNVFKTLNPLLYPSITQREERFSRKVFVGGLPPDIDEEEITAAFKRFGTLVVDWPHKAESKSYFPPKGYCFLLFQEELSVQNLIESCIMDENKYYWCVSSPTIKDKPVQIRPWSLADSDFVMDGSEPLDPRKTIFVGGVPRPLRAVELAMIMDRLYGGVCYSGIDTDPELKYPKGAGRVAFSNQQSYIAAISARFVQLQHHEIDKRVEVKPYVLDDQMCDECQGSRCGGKFAPFFCANVTCLQYYCEQCWAQIHSRQGREYHKPLVKEGADRPRTVPFRW